MQLTSNRSLKRKTSRWCSPIFSFLLGSWTWYSLQ